MEEEEKYLNYSIESFIEDENFQQWVLEPTPELKGFWQSFLDKNPQKLDDINEARVFIQNLKEVQKIDSSALKNRNAIDKILTSIQEEKVVHIQSNNGYQKYIIGIAASLLLLLSVSLVFFNLNSTKNSLAVETQYGDSKAITLKDSTIITLNGNSIVERAGDRKVVLAKGEAHFNVTKKIDSAKFIVETKNSVLTVLGTAFTVYERDDSLSVHLETGKLKITLNNTEENATDFYIVPGDLFTYSAESNKADIENNTSIKYSTWMDGDYIFERKSIRHILIILKKTYGVDVYANEELLDKTMTGKVPTHDINLMIQLIANAVGAEVSFKDEKYYME